MSLLGVRCKQFKINLSTDKAMEVFLHDKEFVMAFPMAQDKIMVFYRQTIDGDASERIIIDEELNQEAGHNDNEG